MSPNPAMPAPLVTAPTEVKPTIVAAPPKAAAQTAVAEAQPKQALSHLSTVSVPTQVPAWVQYSGPYATAFAAIVAATIAGIIAVRSINAARSNLVLQMNAQREIAAKASRASVVSANRQKWIDGVREDLADFIAADFAILEHYEQIEDDLSEAELLGRSGRFAEAMRTRRIMQRRIQLRLNPEKNSHKLLYQAVLNLIPATGSDHKAARGRLIKTAQAFLRREWLRVKAEAGDWDAAISSRPDHEGPEVPSQQQTQPTTDPANDHPSQ